MLILRHTVTAAQEGRLLRTVLHRDLRFSTALLQTLKATGGVAVDGGPLYMNQRVAAGARIEVSLPPEPPTDAPAEEGALSILYEDEALLALDKPAGMLVHPSLSLHYGTLLGRALGYLRRKGEAPVLHPVHRLDRDTSGIVLLARHGFVQAHLMDQMKHGEVRKRYLAVLYGALPQPEGEIALPIGRDPDHYLLRRIDPEGQPAHTRYRVLDTAQVAGQTLSRVSLTPLTGRTHQLRVHCAALGAPVLGDPQYSTPACAALSGALGFRGQLLHAQEIGFWHPLTGEWVEIVCPMSRGMDLF